MEKNNNWKYLRNLIPIIGIILFIYIILNIGFEKISNAFLSIPILFFVLALLLSIPRVLLYAYKWQYICKKQKMHFNILYLAKIFLITLFYGVVTPGSLGTHIRVYYLKEKGKITIEKCLANSVIDATTGFMVGLFLALIGSIVLFENAYELFPVILAFFILFVIFFVVLMKKKTGSKFFQLLIKPLVPRKYRDKLDQTIEEIYKDIPRIRDLFWPFALEGLIWFLGAFQVYVIAIGFSIDIPFHIFIFVSIISVVATGILPISIGGLGVREGTFVFLMAAYGMEPQIAFVIPLGGFLAKILLPGVAGLIISFIDKESILER